MAEWSKALVLGTSHFGGAGSNPVPVNIRSSRKSAPIAHSFLSHGKTAVVIELCKVDSIADSPVKTVLLQNRLYLILSGFYQIHIVSSAFDRSLFFNCFLPMELLP